MQVLIDGVEYVPKGRPGPVAGIPFGEVLKGFRENHRWSLDEAANKAGISKTYLWELESGKAADPSFRVAARLAKIYCIDLAYLASSLDV